MTKPSRWVLPEDCDAILMYANALKRFAETRNPDEFTEFCIPHTNMAEALIAIANGDDAREVFRQIGESGRQSRQRYDRTRATVYWKVKVQGGTHKDGLDAARNHFKEYVPIPSDDESLARIVRAHKEFAFEALEKMGFDVTEQRSRSKAKARRGKQE